MLSTLTKPLTARGRVWFSAPNRFHWELGDPAQTIAVRQSNQVLIIYPNLKRAERYPLHEKTVGPWKDAMALLDAGFPRSRQEIESRFNIVSLRELDGMAELDLQPKSASARQLMPGITLIFSTRDGLLSGTQLKFGDGTTLRNDFTHVIVNPKLDPSLFEPVLGPGFKITQPAAK